MMNPWAFHVIDPNPVRGGKSKDKNFDVDLENVNLLVSIY